MTERSNQLTDAKDMVRMLQADDVPHVFGLCGDTLPNITPWHGWITTSLMVRADLRRR